jgi:hypothetical protein
MQFTLRLALQRYGNLGDSASLLDEELAAKGLLWLRSGSHMGVKRVQFDYLSPHWDITAASSSAPDMTSADPSAALSQPTLRAGRRREDALISGCAALARGIKSPKAGVIPMARPRQVT